MAFKQLLHLVWNSLQRRSWWLRHLGGEDQPGFGAWEAKGEKGVDVGSCASTSQQEACIPALVLGAF